MQKPLAVHAPVQAPLWRRGDAGREKQQATASWQQQKFKIISQKAS